MAIPDPIEMPSPLPVNSKQFDLEYAQLTNPAGRGFIQAIDRSEPSWVAKYSTPSLDPNRDLSFQAFLDKLRGAQGAFLGFDPRKTRPFAYRHLLGEPWLDGAHDAIQLVESDFEASTLQLENFVAGATLTTGDMISYKKVNCWWLHRAIETQSADGSGSITIQVVPRPETATGLTTDVRLIRACCAMKILGRIEKSDQVDQLGSKYSFSSVQFKDRSTD